MSGTFKCAASCSVAVRNSPSPHHKLRGGIRLPQLCGGAHEGERVLLRHHAPGSADDGLLAVDAKLFAQLPGVWGSGLAANVRRIHAVFDDAQPIGRHQPIARDDDPLAFRYRDQLRR